MSALTGAVCGGFALLAQATQWEGWLIGEEEVRGVFKAAGRVGRHYPSHMSQKALDWGALTVALGSSVGARSIGYAVELRKRRVERGLVGQGATVHHLRPVASSPPPAAPAAPEIVPALDPGGDDGSDAA